MARRGATAACRSETGFAGRDQVKMDAGDHDGHTYQYGFDKYHIKILFNNYLGKKRPGPGAQPKTVRTYGEAQATPPWAFF
ncbi:MAG: hypothetical protein RSH52_36025 [Janthinobacterium sp.]